MRISTEYQRDDSEIFVEYTGTVIQRISKIISIATVGVIFVYIIKGYKRKKG